MPVSIQNAAAPLALHALRAAIVDLDGTMVDTLGDFQVALQRMLNDMPPPYNAYTVEREVVARVVGKGSEHLIKSLLALIDPARAATDLVADVALGWQRYQHHYTQINGEFSDLYPGVVDGLRALQARGWRLACVTNKPHAFAVQLLQDKGLAGFFEFTLGGDSLPRKKPDPLPLTTACERLGTAPAQTLMVGDSSNDAQAARAAGCPVLLVRYGYNHGEPIEAAGADAYADSLVDCFSASGQQA